ncbi:MAG: LamG-like jellyroll fold domain-containing protein, partial [Pseudomonadota bacterium]
IDISYSTVDTNGDGLDDSVLSLIRLYSQQGNGGGAHDEDELGILAVIGDMVTEDMVTTDAGAHLGVVQTIDDLQEALAPSDDPSSVTRPGDVFGYDDRDVEGRPLTSDPLAYSVNPFMDEVAPIFDWQVAGAEPNAVLNTHAGGSFDGTDHSEMAHDTDEQQTQGTYLLSFTANSPGEGNQALLSKDFSGNQDGGHLTIWIDGGGNLKVRFQSTNSEQYLRMPEDIKAGKSYDIAFSYSSDSIALYVDGVLEDSDDGFDAGMVGNNNSTVIGASTRKRNDNNENLEWFFDGEVSNVAVLDEDINAFEAILLAENGNDPSILDATYEDPDPDRDPTPDPDTGDDTVRLELGYTEIRQPDRDTWHTVTFEDVIEDAVVVMGPLERNGGHDATVHVRNVTDTGFEFQINEWSYHDGWHMTEGVSWMAISEGTHELASGATIAAGSTQSSSNLNSSIIVDLDGFEDTPSIFSQVTSANESSALATRHSDVSDVSFTLKLQEEEGAPDAQRAVETIDWIAISDDIGDILNLVSVDGGINHRFTSVDFDEVEGEMVLLAAMQTTNGANTANLRYRDLENDSVELKVAEERSKDQERWHLFEEVDVVAGTSGSFDLEIV